MSQKENVKIISINHVLINTLLNNKKHKLQCYILLSYLAAIYRIQYIQLCFISHLLYSGCNCLLSLLMNLFMTFSDQLTCLKKYKTITSHPKCKVIKVLTCAGCLMNSPTN